MSVEQANQLASVEGVLHVTPDRLQSMDTSSTPTFLGLDDPGGLWDQLGGVGGPEEASSSASVDRESRQSLVSPAALTNRVSRVLGARQFTRGYTAGMGSAKRVSSSGPGCAMTRLIGAMHFNAAWGGNSAVEAQRPGEAMSPARLQRSRYSHLIPTASGNHNTTTTGPATALGSISGMAPHAA